MSEHHDAPDEPMLDPVDLPPPGGSEAVNWVTRMKNQRAGFSCLGLGCFAWLTILAAAAGVWLLLR